MKQTKAVSEQTDKSLQELVSGFQVAEKSISNKLDDKEQKRAKLVEALQQEMAIIAAKGTVTIDDTEAVMQRVAEFMQRAKEKGRVVTISSLYVALGMDSEAVSKWINEFPDHPTSKFLVQMKQAICENMEVAALQGDTNNVTSIFLLKSTGGYREGPQEHIITNGNEMGSNKTNEQLNKSFAEFIDAEFSEVDE